MWSCTICVTTAGTRPASSTRILSPPSYRDSASIARGIDRHFGAKPKIGVFHSLSAQTAVLQAAERAAFSALVLFEPVLCPPGRPPQDLKKLEATMLQLGKAARKRQERFATPEEFAERLRRCVYLQALAARRGRPYRADDAPSGHCRNGIRITLPARIRSPGIRGGLSMGAGRQP